MTFEAARNKIRAEQRACYRSKTQFGLLLGLTGSADRSLAHKTGHGVENASRIQVLSGRSSRVTVCSQFSVCLDTRPLIWGVKGSPFVTWGIFLFFLFFFSEKV